MFWPLPLSRHLEVAHRVWMRRPWNRFGRPFGCTVHWQTCLMCICTHTVYSTYENSAHAYMKMPKSLAIDPLQSLYTSWIRTDHRNTVAKLHVVHKQSRRFLSWMALLAPKPRHKWWTSLLVICCHKLNIIKPLPRIMVPSQFLPFITQVGFWITGWLKFSCWSLLIPLQNPASFSSLFSTSGLYQRFFMKFHDISEISNRSKCLERLDPSFCSPDQLRPLGPCGLAVRQKNIKKMMTWWGSMTAGGSHIIITPPIF